LSAAAISGGSPAKWPISAPDGSYTLRPSVSSTRKACSVATMIVAPPSSVGRETLSASLALSTLTAPACFVKGAMCKHSRPNGARHLFKRSQLPLNRQLLECLNQL
jgi:hypothetical protein